MKKVETNNLFSQPSTLEFQAPNFSKIHDEDFRPAFEEAIKQKLEEIKSIAAAIDAPTFENTLEALEKSGQMLSRVAGAFYSLSSANTNDTLQKIEEEVAPKFAALRDAIYLNNNLFKRVERLYKNKEQLCLDKEGKRLLEYYYEHFILSGAKLSDEAKTEMKQMNEEIASLITRFANKLLAATKSNYFVTDKVSDLAGLSEEAIQSAARQAKNKGKNGKWVITLDNTTQQMALSSLTNRSVREKIFKKAWNRAELNDSNDTRKTLLRIAELRAKQAKIMGFESYAAWSLQDQMAKTPKAVQDFFNKLVSAATKNAEKEAKELQEMIDRSGEHFDLQAWDWNFYAEKLRKEKYDLNEEDIMPYFELYNVLENGVFYAANQLYGLTFRERKDFPVYQEDVRTFEVIDKDGEPLGLFYCDFFKRDNKNGGAWMNNIVDQSHLLKQLPVIINVCNYAKPAPGQPALITWDEVTTMFHEFGHALHGFFANQKYPSLSGTAVARDFVELPSQLNEHWALEPKVFKNYAVHFKTKKPMPQELEDKIKNSSTFNQGYRLTELLAAAQLDMQWHSISADENIDDVDKFETLALKRTNLYLEVVPPRYRSSYFRHIWDNGYAAGYYAYLWTEMLEMDAFSWFESHGGMTRENGQHYRNTVLSRGNTEDYNQMFNNLVGREPRIEPMLKGRGLINSL